MIHSFLLIGQSNAAGRGFFAEAEPLDTCDGRLKVLRNGRWQKMFRPVNPDRNFSGTSLAESFAKEYALDHPEVDVGIIPCADGGTAISKWLPGEILFDNAVNCAKLAMRTSSLRGIIWHQGESDCTEEKYTVYAERLTCVMDTLRKELGCPDIPIIIGKLGDFLANCEKDINIAQNYVKVNEIIEEFALEYPNCSLVSADGLGGNPDNLHFSAAALKEFGIRYYAEYKKFDNIYASEEVVNTDTERSSIEAL